MHDTIGSPTASRREPSRAAVEVKALGFSLHKRRYLASFLPGASIRWIDDPSCVRAGEAVAVWASNAVGAELERDGARVLRVEDGFLRSVGLGAHLTRPLSWVVDGSGIHYDASRPSDLETLLQTGGFDRALLDRARALREAIVAAGLTKYNVGATGWPGLSPRRPAGRPAILVVGQVETDASIRTGAGSIRTNAALMRRVRQDRPDAWIVYKPHPDVVAGLRGAGDGEADAASICDEVVSHVSIERVLEAVESVHVNTSLTGFEALLRGKPVHCHGSPFYAGWGLTRDATPVARRRRLLSLDELVAGALLLYPRYASGVSGRPCSAEEALGELIAWRSRDDGRMRWWQTLLRPVLRRD